MVNKIEILPGIEGCVYKLWYADKYIVVKCKTLVRSVQNINTNIEYYFKHLNHDKHQKDNYLQFYQHIQQHPGKQFKIDILLQSNNPYQLLIAEQTALDAGMEDENCLNILFDAYIPQSTQRNGEKSWINRGYYLNFCIWRKKLREKCQE